MSGAGIFVRLVWTTAVAAMNWRKRSRMIESCYLQRSSAQAEKHELVDLQQGTEIHQTLLEVLSWSCVKLCKSDERKPERKRVVTPRDTQDAFTHAVQPSQQHPTAKMTIPTHITDDDDDDDDGPVTGVWCTLT